MHAITRHQENPVARRFAQVCTVALAAFLTSALGLLTYLSLETPPVWLRSLALTSASIAAISFVGWIVSSIRALSRSPLDPH